MPEVPLIRDSRFQVLLPYAVFGLLTLAVFHGFLFQGRTFVTVSVLERQLGRELQQPAWIKPERPPVRVADNGALLPMLLKVYNEGLHRNELALWNPNQFCGYPLTYDTMVHPFYPPHLVLHRLFSWEAAYGWTLLLHFFAAGVAMFHLLRGLGRTDVAATLGGLVWTLFGFNALWFSSGILLGVSVFGPLALLAIVRGLEKGSLPHAGWAGAAYGMAILGSHPQLALLLFLFLLAWIAVHRAWRFGLVFSLLSTGVGLVAILTRLDSLENGWRDPGADILSIYGGNVFVHLSGLVLGKAYPPKQPHLAYELAVHAGLAATSLALAGAIRAWKELRVRFVAIFSAAALLAAFLFGSLLGAIPGLNFSPPSRWIFVAGFGLSILAARGVDSLRDGPGRWPWILGGAALLVLLTGQIETILGFALAAGAAFAARKSLKAGAGLAFAAVLFELLPPFYFGHNWPMDGALLREKRDLPEGRSTGLIGATPHANEFYLSDLVEGEPLLAYFGAETVGGFEAIIPDPYVRFALAAGALKNPAGRSLTWTTFDSPLLDMAGLRTLYLPPNLSPGPRFEKVSATERVVVWRNPRAFPRAWVVGKAVVSEKLDVDFRTTAVLDVEPPPLDPMANGIVRRLPDGAWEVESTGPSLLVVSETWDAGWEAERDGVPVPVLRANGAFRAVPLAGGRHRVEFFYRPAAVVKGLIGSALFLLLALGWPLLTFLRRLNVSARANVEATHQR